MHEKRGHLRAQLSIPVLCEPTNGERFAGMLTDLGVDGCCIESAAIPPFGAELELEVRLPGSPDLSRVPAIVRWTRAGGFGVQFRSLGARDTRLVAQLMAETLRPASSRPD